MPPNQTPPEGPATAAPARIRFAPARRALVVGAVLVSATMALTGVAGAQQPLVKKPPSATSSATSAGTATSPGPTASPRPTASPDPTTSPRTATPTPAPAKPPKQKNAPSPTATASASATASPSTSPTPSAAATGGKKHTKSKNGAATPSPTPSASPATAPPPFIGPVAPKPVGPVAPPTTRPVPPAFIGPVAPRRTRHRITGVVSHAATARLVPTRHATPRPPVRAQVGLPPGTNVLPAVQTIVTRSVQRPAAPIGLGLIVLLFLLVQHRIDRRDPKLARNGARELPDLEFGAVIGPA